MSLSGHAMAFDSDRQLVIAFGGETVGDSASAATWGWNGKAWTCLVPASARVPKSRSAAILTYDAARRVLVLYGGRRGRAALRDTWELGANGWALRDTAGPTPGPHGVMAFDASSRTVLLYHTRGDDGPERVTWSWDGHRWSTRAAGPNEEFPDAMISSAGTHPALLITARPTTTPDAFDAPIYEWNADRWIPVSVQGAHPAFSPQAPAARTGNGAIIFAGFEPGGSVKMWALEHGVWRQHTGTLPSRRRGTAMVLDTSRGVVVLHGGDDGTRILGDTWEWSGGQWRRVAS